MQFFFWPRKQLCVHSFVKSGNQLNKKHKNGNHSMHHKEVTNRTYNPVNTLIESYSNHCEVMTGPTIATRIGRLLVNKFTNPIFLTACHVKGNFGFNQYNFKLKIKTVNWEKWTMRAYLKHSVSLLVIERRNNVVCGVRNKCTNSSSCISSCTCHCELLRTWAVHLSFMNNVCVYKVHRVLKCREHYNWNCKNNFILSM